MLSDKNFINKAKEIASASKCVSKSVGAVIVKDGRILSTGYNGTPPGYTNCNDYWDNKYTKEHHEWSKTYEIHAEMNAIIWAARKGISIEGATIYVTLEPCNHYGKTPPCTEKILQVGISQVICGIRDPNPIAKGGLEILKSKGVEVKAGVLEKEAKILTRFFLSRIIKKKPWVIMKVAASIDGKIAVSTGDSKWITGEQARKYGHK